MIYLPCTKIIMANMCFLDASEYRQLRAGLSDRPSWTHYYPVRGFLARLGAYVMAMNTLVLLALAHSLPVLPLLSLGNAMLFFYVPYVLYLQSIIPVPKMEKDERWRLNASDFVDEECNGDAEKAEKLLLNEIDTINCRYNWIRFTVFTLCFGIIGSSLATRLFVDPLSKFDWAKAQPESPLFLPALVSIGITLFILGILQDLPVAWLRQTKEQLLHVNKLDVPMTK